MILYGLNKLKALRLATLVVVTLIIGVAVVPLAIASVIIKAILFIINMLLAFLVVIWGIIFNLLLPSND